MNRPAARGAAVAFSRQVLLGGVARPPVAPGRDEPVGFQRAAVAFSRQVHFKGRARPPVAPRPALPDELASQWPRGSSAPHEYEGPSYQLTLAERPGCRPWAFHFFPSAFHQGQSPETAPDSRLRSVYRDLEPSSTIPQMETHSKMCPCRHNTSNESNSRQ